MRKLLFIALIVGVQFGCKKENDLRLDFVGSYSGVTISKFYMNGNLEVTNSKTANYYIRMGTNENELIINDELKATIINNTYTLNPTTTIEDLGNGKKLTTNTTGKGTILNNGNLSVIIQGSGYSGELKGSYTTTGTLTKLTNY